MKKTVNPPLKYRLRSTDGGLRARDVDTFDDDLRPRRRWGSAVGCLAFSALAFCLARLVGCENGQLFLAASLFCFGCSWVCWPREAK